MTEFERLVLAVVDELQQGQLVSYGWVASEAGKPGAARAVGNGSPGAAGAAAVAAARAAAANASALRPAGTQPYMRPRPAVRTSRRKSGAKSSTVRHISYSRERIRAPILKISLAEERPLQLGGLNALSY